MAAACSQPAFDELVGRHRSLLRVLARRFAPDRDDRDDLIQVVILCLLDKRKKALRDWEPVAPFAAYLTTIGSRRGIRFSQQQARLPQLARAALPEGSDGVLDGFIPPDDLSSPDPPVDLQAEAAERSEALMEAVGRLSPRDRLVIRLRFLEGLESPSVAALLGVTKGAARKAIFDATRRLRAALYEQGAQVFVEP